MVGLQYARTSIHDYVPVLRASGDGDNADRCLSVYLRLQGLRGSDEAEARGLLHILLVRFHSLSTDAGMAAHVWSA